GGSSFEPWSRFRAIIRDAQGDPPEDTGVESYVRGKATGDRLTLRIVKQIGRAPFGNAFAPILEASLHPEDGGTRLTGRFRMSRVVQGFCVVWVIGVVMAETLLFLGRTSRGDRLALHWC